jgi:tetratricopeptide (TPR) repeat protein
MFKKNISFAALDSIEGKFIEIEQYGVGRYELKNATASIAGLCTSNLNVCVAIILISSDRNKLLLTHVDTNIHENSLVHFFSWFKDEKYSLHFCLGKNLSTNNNLSLQNNAFSPKVLLDRLESALAKNALPKWSNCVTHYADSGFAAITLSGEIILTPIDKKKHPEAETRSAVNFINYFASWAKHTKMYALMDLDLCFNSGAWMMGMPQLDTFGKKLVQHFRQNSTVESLYNKQDIPTDFVQLLQSISEIFLEKMKLYLQFEKKIEQATLFKESGNNYVQQQQHEKALTHYKLAVSLVPSMKEAWFNLGLTLVQLKNNEEAIVAFDKALNIDSQYQKALWNKGSLLMQQGKLIDALELFQQILKINPNHQATLQIKKECLLALSNSHGHDVSSSSSNTL